MVCPKCGRECGSDAFCGGCGTKLEAAQTRNTGRLCPHCGGTEAIGNICAYCGLTLEDPALPTTEDSYQVPRREFLGSFNRIQLSQDALVLGKPGFLKWKFYRIPYDHLTQVRYEREKDEKLVICWKEEPKGIFLLCDYEQIRLFFHIFFVLRAQTRPDVKFSLHCAPMDETLRPLACKVDMDACFDRFSPYRDEAAQAVQMELGISLLQARAIVDQAFDERQRALYDMDSSSAVRDLNRIDKVYQQIQEDKKRKREERNRKAENYHW